MSSFSSLSLGGRKHSAFLWPLISGPLRKILRASKNSFWNVDMPFTAALSSIWANSMLMVKPLSAYSVELNPLEVLR